MQDIQMQMAKNGHHVKNASGQWGYILSSSVTPYLGGSSCNATAVVGVTGAVLRASASDTGTPVQEAIPKGTSLAIGAAKKDSGGKIWYYSWHADRQNAAIAVIYLLTTLSVSTGTMYTERCPQQTAAMRSRQNPPQSGEA